MPNSGCVSTFLARESIAFIKFSKGSTIQTGDTTKDSLGQSLFHFPYKPPLYKQGNWGLEKLCAKDTAKKWHSRTLNPNLPTSKARVFSFIMCSHTVSIPFHPLKKKMAVEKNESVKPPQTKDHYHALSVTKADSRLLCPGSYESQNFNFSISASIPLE